MKKLLTILMSCSLLVACSNNGGESGAVDDGMKPIDANGGLTDSTNNRFDPSTDSVIGDDRVDTEKRDSSKQ
jgi:hypothetical protein